MQTFLFPTQLGWAAVMTDEGAVCDLRFGFPSELELVRYISEFADTIVPVKKAWQSHISAIKRFCEGKKTELKGIPISFGENTPFQLKVLKACHAIPYGETISYAGLARKTKSPRACRAVGSVMSRNRIPLLIPCHRVVKTDGTMGTYSGPNGISMKAKLLELESSL